MNNPAVRVTPSLFAADFYNLSAAVSQMEKAGVDRIHYDVMDQHFVPNLSYGPKVIEDIIRRTSLPADLHLMIELQNGEALKPYLDLNAGHITLHYETCGDRMDEYLAMIRRSGKTAGLSVKPGTAVEVLAPWLGRIDHVLLMSVEPGFSGQSFMPDSVGRMKKLAALAHGKPLTLQIDGGIGRGNMKEVVAAGANDLVMGSAFFKDSDTAGLVAAVHALTPGKE